MNCLFETVWGAGSLLVHLALNLGTACIGSPSSSAVVNGHTVPLQSVLSTTKYLADIKKAPI